MAMTFVRTREQLIVILLVLIMGGESLSAKVEPTKASDSRLSAITTSTPATTIVGDGCSNQGRADTSRALTLLREAMRQRKLLRDIDLDAFIVVSTDEHQNEEPAEEDRRLKYATGWFGTGKAAITHGGAVALWTPATVVEQAKMVVACRIEVFDLTDPVNTTAYWLSKHIPIGGRVGIDSRLVEHDIWADLASQLNSYRLNLIGNIYMFDAIWNMNGRPEPSRVVAELDKESRAGQPWLEKVTLLRAQLRHDGVEAMIVTALDEIAWLLNIRGKDLPYSPLLKGFLILSQSEIRLYVPRGKLSPVEVRQTLGTDGCYSKNCTLIFNYETFYQDLRTLSQAWRNVLIPMPDVYHRGASEEIVQCIPAEKRYFKISPIIYMKAKKNEIEREQMRIAQIKDAAALIQILTHIEAMIFNGNHWNELEIIELINLNRESQSTNKGISRRTIVAFGPNGAIPEYQAHMNTTKIISFNSTVVIESGGHYESGTAVCTRTLHYGKPTVEEKRAYTTVLQSAIELSSLIFPATLHASNIDTVARAPLWQSQFDYPHSTGHGVGALLNYREDPIDLHYNHDMSQESLKEGYFLTNEPGFYEPGKFGVRLGNVMEVVAAKNNKSDSTAYLMFRDVTLVPYEPRLIEIAMLTKYQRHWLNAYNLRVQEVVGDELRSLGYMQAYYWMMNNTALVEEDPFRSAAKRNYALGIRHLSGLDLIGSPSSLELFRNFDGDCVRNQ